MSYDENIDLDSYDDISVPYQCIASDFEMAAYAEMEVFSASYDEDTPQFAVAETQASVSVDADGYAVDQQDDSENVGDTLLGDGYDDGEPVLAVESYSSPVVSLREPEQTTIMNRTVSQELLRIQKYYEAVRLLEEGGQTCATRSIPKLKAVLAEAGEELTDVSQFFSCMQQYTAIDNYEQTSCKFSKQLRDSSKMSRAFPYDEFDVALRYSYSLGSSGSKATEEIEFSDSSDEEGAAGKAPRKPVGNERQWNEEFQALLDMPDCRAKFLGLRQLEHDFVHTAQLYGKIIIGESCVPNAKKTIKPIDIGGIAGGEKFICQGILFKFAVDSFGLYRGDANAIKAAGLELSALMHYYHCNIAELHVPLMALIDYRGYRLMAVSLLPISSSSICYGTANAGVTVHADPKFEKHMAHVGEILNVKPHVVGQDQVMIHGGPGDIEGHIGTDGRMYLLDFARLAPPMVPKAPGQTLYRHFRMEFVRSYSKPLSSDAFSRMAPDPEKTNALEVKEAQAFFMANTIPNLASSLDEMVKKEVPTPADLIFIFHKAGVNLRFFGHVRQLLESDVMRDLLLHEAIARTVKSHMKQLFRDKMAQIGVPSDEPFRRVVLDLISLILGQRGNYSSQYWNAHIPSLALEKYPELLTIEEQKPGGLQAATDRIRVVKRVLQITGVKVSSDAQQVLNGDIKCPDLAEIINPDEFELLDQDLLRLDSYVKHMNIIEYADGMSLFYDAIGKDLSSPSKRRLLTLSKRILLQSLKASSMNLMAKYQLGNVFRVMGTKLIAPGSTSENLSPCTNAAALTMLESITTFKSLLRERIEPGLRYRTCISLGKVLWARGRLVLDQNEMKTMVDECLKHLRQAKDITDDLQPSYLAAKALAQAAPLAVRVHKDTEYASALFDQACERLAEVLARPDVEPKRPSATLLLASTQLLRWLLVPFSTTPGHDPSKTIAGFLGQADRSRLVLLFREVDIRQPEEFWKLFSITMQADPPSDTSDSLVTPGGSVFDAFVDYCNASGLEAVTVTKDAEFVSKSPTFAAALNSLLTGCPTVSAVVVTGVSATAALSALSSVNGLSSLTFESLSPELTSSEALSLMISMPSLKAFSVDSVEGDASGDASADLSGHELVSLSLKAGSINFLWALPATLKQMLLSVSTDGLVATDAHLLLNRIDDSCPKVATLAIRSTEVNDPFASLTNSAVKTLDASGTPSVTLACALAACSHVPGLTSVVLSDGAVVHFGSASETARIVLQKPLTGGIQTVKATLEARDTSLGNVSVLSCQQIGNGSHMMISAGRRQFVRVKHNHLMNGLRATLSISSETGEDLGQIILSKQVLGQLTNWKGTSAVAGQDVTIAWQEKVVFNRKSITFTLSLAKGSIQWQLEERGNTLLANGTVAGDQPLSLSLIAIIGIAVVQVLTAKR